MNILETERLYLRQFSTEDAEFILELLNEPSFIQNIGDRGVRTLDDAGAYLLNGPVASYAKNGFGLYRVVLKETDESIGMCGLIKRDGSGGCRYWLCLPAQILVKGICGRSGAGGQGLCKRCDRVEAPGCDHRSGQRRLDPRPGKDRACSSRKWSGLSEDDIELKLFAVDL